MLEKQNELEVFSSPEATGLLKSAEFFSSLGWMHFVRQRKRLRMIEINESDKPINRAPPVVLLPRLQVHQHNKNKDINLLKLLNDVGKSVRSNYV